MTESVDASPIIISNAEICGAAAFAGIDRIFNRRRGMKEESEFVCPECGERIIVNGGVREALLENGCLLCDAELSSSDFRPVSGPSQ